ncbi:MAG: CHAT domain-containing protein [Thermoanaerobaculia bacterium]
MPFAWTLITQTSLGPSGIQAPSSVWTLFLRQELRRTSTTEAEPCLRRMSADQSQPPLPPESLVTSQPPAKLLFLAAAPDDREKLRFDRELRNVREGLRLARFGDHFDLDDVLASRPKDLHRALLDHKPRIVHFSGHGDSNGQILLEGDNGWAKPVAAEALADLFALCKEGLDCVIFNACSTALPSKALARHIPFVIGMASEVEDRAAICFVEGFYDGLGAEEPYTRAFEHGRARMSLEGFNGRNLPVLYRGPGSSEDFRIRRPATPPRDAPPLAQATDYSQLSTLSPAEIQSVIQQYKASLLSGQEDPETLQALGLLYLQVRLYDAASKHLSRSLELAPDLTDSHYYLALALLRGRPARVPSLSEIREIDRLVSVAIALGGAQVKYCALAAAIRHDFYEANGLAPPPPDWRELLQQARSARPDPWEVRRLLQCQPLAKSPVREFLMNAAH